MKYARTWFADHQVLQHSFQRLAVAEQLTLEEMPCLTTPLRRKCILAFAICKSAAVTHFYNAFGHVMYS